jgi:ankyrin repeat domain-containing protein 17
MEAASGGYESVGRVLIDKGADVNAPPVPVSKDTALTIASDKGHTKFVQLLIENGGTIDTRNKKGFTPLWLACSSGHLDVCQILVANGANADIEDLKKVSCLMAAFRKGHIKIVKYIVKHVKQFPSDTDCMKYIASLNEKELVKKCQQCMEIIINAKEKQAQEANKIANSLLKEIDAEKIREKSKKAAAARKREKRKMKKKIQKETSNGDEEKLANADDKE